MSSLEITVKCVLTVLFVGAIVPTILRHLTELRGSVGRAFLSIVVFIFLRHVLHVVVLHVGDDEEVNCGKENDREEIKRADQINNCDQPCLLDSFDDTLSSATKKSAHTPNTNQLPPLVSCGISLPDESSSQVESEIRVQASRGERLWG